MTNEYLIITYLIICLPVAFYARSRGNSFIMGLLGAIIFTPILGAIFATFGGKQKVIVVKKDK